MAQPSSVPRWATDAGAGILEPTSGKKDTGFAAGEKPRAGHFDWLFNTIYLWVLYLQNLTAEALTWTAAHTFNAAVVFASTVTAGDWRFTAARTRATLAGNGFGMGSFTFTRDADGVYVVGGTQDDEWYIPVNVESGERITGWTAEVRHSVNSATQMTANLVRQDATGAITNVGSLQNSVASTARQNLTQSGLTHDVVSGNAYFILVTQVGSAQAFNHFRGAAVVTRP